MSDGAASDGQDATSKTPCGLIMPIAEWDGCRADHWAEVKDILTSAIESIPDHRFSVNLVSASDGAGVIHTRIVRNVYSNPIVVCDVSGRNPNVLFELGLRIAFDRPVVLIKDDQTAFSFDISPLEHIVYPRSLRHAAIETFKAELVRKVSATYRDWQQPSDARPSYIRSFGPITAVQFAEQREPADRAILSAIEKLTEQIQTISPSPVFSNSPASWPKTHRFRVAFKPNMNSRVVQNELHAKFGSAVAWSNLLPRRGIAEVTLPGEPALVSAVENFLLSNPSVMGVELMPPPMEAGKLPTTDP